MKIGLSLTPNRNQQTDPHEAVRHLVWAAQYADEHDFDIVWSTEHHFTDVAFSSSPSVILSHYAAVTKRVQLGYAVAILPFHHPVRLAEDMAWVDTFSNGRLIAGVSPGWAAYEFSVLGLNVEKRRELFADGLAVLKKALTGEKFSHDGEYWKVPETRIMPPPLQKKLNFVTATTSNEGLKMAAQERMSPLLGFGPPESLAESRAYYIECLREDGASEEEIQDLLSRLGSLRRVIIRDTDEEAEEEALEAVTGFRRNSSTLQVDAKTGQPVEGIVRRHIEQQDDPKKTYAFSGTVQGSPEKVVQTLLKLREVGLGSVVLQFHTTTRNTDGVKDNIRKFATEVLPEYRKAVAKLPAMVG